jgi:hypothetical protein
LDLLDVLHPCKRDPFACGPVSDQETVGVEPHVAEGRRPGVRQSGGTKQQQGQKRDSISCHDSNQEANHRHSGHRSGNDVAAEQGVHRRQALCVPQHAIEVCGRCGVGGHRVEVGALHRPAPEIPAAVTSLRGGRIQQAAVRAFHLMNDEFVSGLRLWTVESRQYGPVEQPRTRDGRTAHRAGLVGE